MAGLSVRGVAPAEVGECRNQTDRNRDTGKERLQGSASIRWRFEGLVYVGSRFLIGGWW